MRVAFAVATTIACVTNSQSTRAQCTTDWLANTFGVPGFDGDVRAMIDWDDGTGRALYVGGSFSTVGTVECSAVARLRGQNWSAVGSESPPSVLAFATFDDDSDGPHLPTLFAASTSGVYQLQGSAWTRFPNPSGNINLASVYALAVFDDDGAGAHAPSLYAAGDIYIGSQRVGIARWSGGTWSAVRNPNGEGVNGTVYALQVFDEDAAGPQLPALYAGGEFSLIGSSPANSIAKWNGQSWSVLSGSGGVGVITAGDFPGTILCFSVFDEDGSGPATPSLIVGGSMFRAGGVIANNIARWRGGNWSALTGGAGNGVNNYAYAMDVHDLDGDGPVLPSLYVGGNFSNAGGVPADRIASWNGTSWDRVAGPNGVGLDGDARVVKSFDPDGVGALLPRLLVGGRMLKAGGVGAFHFASWDGHEWTGTSGQDRNGLSLSGFWGEVNALRTFDPDGQGPTASELYVGGDFDFAGGVPAQDIASWNGTRWAAIPGSATFSTFSFVKCFAVFDDDGTGPNAPALYVGGAFTSVGGLTVNHIARWDGVNWSGLAGPQGTGLDGGSFPIASAMVVFDEDGDGPMRPALFVGGAFTSAGGIVANGIARWDGLTWSGVSDASGNGVWHSLYLADVRALEVATIGSAQTPALFVGGRFMRAGGVLANGVAKWNGSLWSALKGAGGGDFESFAQVMALRTYDGDESGPQLPRLIVGGNFSVVDGIAVRALAQWDGERWSGMPRSLFHPTSLKVRSLTVLDFDGNGLGSAELIVGGVFTHAGGIPVENIARWNGSRWYPLDGPSGVGVTYDPGFADAVISAEAYVEPGQPQKPPALYVGGKFRFIGGGLVSRSIARWRLEGSPPPITAIPADQTVPLGQTVSFSVASDDSSAMFLWKRNGVALSDGPNIVGSAGPVLRIISASSSDSGRYECAVSNACGSTTSASARLTILISVPGPSHTLQADSPEPG